MYGPVTGSRTYSKYFYRNTFDTSSHHVRHAAVEGGPDLVPVHVEGDAELAPLPQQVVVEERVVEAELVHLQSR